MKYIRKTINSLSTHKGKYKNFLKLIKFSRRYIKYNTDI